MKHSLTQRHDPQHQQHEGSHRERIPKQRSSCAIKNSFQGNIKYFKTKRKTRSIPCTSMIEALKRIVPEELIKVRKSSSSSLKLDNVEYQEIFLHDDLSSLQVQRKR